MALFAILAAAAAAGALLAATGLHPHPTPRVRCDRSATPPRRLPAARITATAAAAITVGAATRWPVAALLAAVAVWALPPVLAPDRAHRRALQRLEAVSAWAEDLTGTLQAGAGVEEAIIATSTVAPPALADELAGLADALRAGVRLPDGLRAFADDVADPTADLVVNVLLQATQHQAREIATALAGVGHTARTHAAARMRIAAGRARVHTSTRIVITVVLATAGLSVLFAPGFLAPYGTPEGQVVLAAVGAGFAAVITWMVWIGRVADLPRILTRHPPTGET